MKKRMINFLAYISFIAIVCITAVIYYNVNKFQMITWQSKAIIEQVKPLIIEAEGQRAIDFAVANSVYTNSLITLLAFILPYLAIAIFALYKLIPLGVMLYEKVRSAKYSTTVN